MNASDERLDGYFDTLTRVDPHAAGRYVVGLLDEGTPLQVIAAEVLVPAQVRVGRLWQNGTWGVADEHAATAVTEFALNALLSAAGPRLSSTGQLDAPHVLVSCAETEWHTLPARMAGLAAMVTGARVTFLGPSMPAEHLGRRLQAGDVDVLALSCTIPTNLLGAARCVAAAHDAGVPVIVGGRAFGENPQRAFAIGADVFATADELLGSTVPDLAGREIDISTEALLLDTTGSATVEIAYERMVSLFPRLAAMTPFQQARTREDMQWMARFAGAAVLTGDPTVLDDFLSWLCSLLDGKVPATVVAASASLVADALEPEAPAGAQMLRDAAERTASAEPTDR